MKIGVLGCAGRMGKTHLTAILDSEKHEVAAGLERTDSEYIGKDIGSLLGRDPIGITVSGDKEAAIEASDAIIDFTSPALTLECAALAAKHGVIHIIGTTGLDDAQKATLAKHAEKTQIIFAPNMSVGVNLLFSLVEKVASVLDDDFDIEVVEMHHNQKVDSPSGTALGLGEAAAKGRGIALNDVACKARDGQVGARPKGEIGFATLRGGDVVGDHTVIFAGEGERIEVTHKASNRSIYARGALRAAEWAKTQPAGLYSMKDVLDV